MTEEQMDAVEFSFEFTMQHGHVHKSMASRIFDAARTEESIINNCKHIKHEMWREHTDPRDIAPRILDILNRRIPLFIQESRSIGDADPDAFNEIVSFSESVGELLSSEFEDRFRIKIHKPTPRRPVWWMQSEEYGFR